MAESSRSGSVPGSVPQQAHVNLNVGSSSNSGATHPLISDDDDEFIHSSTPLNYQEQLRQQTILNSMENKDYLLVIASQQQKSVQQVKYELLLKLTEGR